MAFASKVVNRFLHVSNVALRNHKRIPPKVMGVNTCYKYPQFSRMGIQPQHYEYFLVLDFEATCEANFKIENQEVIEFPCLKVEGKTFEVEDQFHEFVRPEANPELSHFCIQLTGIIQDMVDDKPTFKEVLSKFLGWLSDNNLYTYGDKQNSIFVTSGDWDLETMLPSQCKLLDIPIPKEMTQWINVKRAFHASTGYYPRGIKDMALQLNIQHEGRLHSGIDDCKNIANIMKSIAERGHIFQKTSP